MKFCSLLVFPGVPSNVVCSIDSFNIFDDFFKTSHCCTHTVSGTFTQNDSLVILKSSVSSSTKDFV